MRHALLVLALAACGGSTSELPGPTAPTSAPAADDAPALQSNDVLARDAATKRAVVKHILIGWRELADAGGKLSADADPRARNRSRAEADALAEKLLGRVRAGENMDALMAEFSEDPGSAKHATEYLVTPESHFVFEFRRLSLRLKVGEAGLVQSEYGWHVIKRFE
jgi:hypothetical protein